MKIYNVVGYLLIATHILLSAIVAPQKWGMLWGVVFGFLYLIYIWFLGGLYLSDVIHMGIAHKTLNYKPWLIKSVVLLNNTTGIYINPTTWVNRHRHHHAFSDHNGDPNKLDEDGFWKTMYLCVFPYACSKNLATEGIFKSWPFRLVSNPYFAAFSQVSSYGLLWLLSGDWLYAAVLWSSVRVFAAVGKHDPELLDARPPVWRAPLHRRARQRDESRRVASRHRLFQRQLAK